MAKKLTLKIDNMMCEKCVERAENALGSVEGVTDLEVSKGKAVMRYDESKTDEERILAAFIDAGYPAKVKKGLF